MGSTWAVDLKDVGAVYPLQGWELIIVLIGIAAWIIWHIIQISQEEADYSDDLRRFGKPEAVKKALEEQHSTWR
ncbi:MAG: hypothetical protein AB7V40_07480 [Methyloceanibacter sp.]